jgi:hypothetical protein
MPVRDTASAEDRQTSGRTHGEEHGGRNCGGQRRCKRGELGEMTYSGDGYGDGMLCFGEGEENSRRCRGCELKCGRGWLAFACLTLRREDSDSGGRTSQLGLLDTAPTLGIK